MTLSADLEEFYRYAPETVWEIRCVEIYHPDIGVHRYTEPYSNKSLKLEAGAPRNASQSVEFTATNLEISEPGEKRNSTPTYVATFGLAGTQISEILDQITDYLTPVEFVYRKYASNNLTAPGDSPVYAYVNTVTFGGSGTVSISGTTDNGALFQTGNIYTLEKFPSLRNL